MSKSSLFLFILAFLLGAGAVWLARHEGREYHYEPSARPDFAVKRAGNMPAGMLSLDEILARLHLPAGTRILEVEREHHAGKLYYEIELVAPDGRVYEYYIDPANGNIIKEKIEDHED